MQARYQRLPRRLLLIRHGESEANVDHTVYSTKPDWRIELTPKGRQQAFQCGQDIRQIIRNEKLYIYYSPYMRTRQTLEEIRKSLSELQVLGECEDERLREQEIGNYQPIEKMDETWAERNRYGRLYYRFPWGESGADVGDRVSCFFNSLLRTNIGLTVPSMNNHDMRNFTESMERVGEAWKEGDLRAAAKPASGGEGDSPHKADGGGVSPPPLEDLCDESDYGVMPHTSIGNYTAGDQNVVVVSHGLLIRLFISRWFNVPVELTETLDNPPNCSIVVLERKNDTDRLVMTDASKALFGNDPRLQLMKFDGQEMTKLYRKKFLGNMDPERRGRQGALENDDMGHYF
ncbi:unnamed protein product [Phytomonas sp. EM1]|nr:unnamed protein product [Phytomonas sp. EM1]|eukprot:CCW60875.1 unnamed protein product [Phytomonas sp. isolate EM1]